MEKSTPFTAPSVAATSPGHTNNPGTTPLYTLPDLRSKDDALLNPPTDRKGKSRAPNRNSPPAPPRPSSPVPTLSVVAKDYVWALSTPGTSASHAAQPNPFGPRTPRFPPPSFLPPSSRNSPPPPPSRTTHNASPPTSIYPLHSPPRSPTSTTGSSDSSNASLLSTRHRVDPESGTAPARNPLTRRLFLYGFCPLFLLLPWVFGACILLRGGKGRGNVVEMRAGGRRRRNRKKSGNEEFNEERYWGWLCVAALVTVVVVGGMVALGVLVDFTPME